MSKMAIVLLHAAVSAQLLSGDMLPDMVEARLANAPIPATRIGLLPNQKHNHASLSLMFGRANLVVGLHDETAKALLEALTAASAEGKPH